MQSLQLLPGASLRHGKLKAVPTYGDMFPPTDAVCGCFYIFVTHNNRQLNCGIFPAHFETRVHLDRIAGRGFDYRCAHRHFAAGIDECEGGRPGGAVHVAVEADCYRNDDIHIGLRQPVSAGRHVRSGDCRIAGMVPNMRSRGLMSMPYDTV